MTLSYRHVFKIKKGKKKRERTNKHILSLASHNKNDYYLHQEASKANKLIDPILEEEETIIE